MSLPENVSPHHLHKLGEWIADRLGWNLDMDGPFIDKRLAQLCDALGFSQSSDCIHSLVKNEQGEKGIQAVAREFSVGESYFFRGPGFFRYLEEQILPALIQKASRNLAVWSVGCSSGEEAYSIAMLLHDRLPGLKGWRIDILGTDINTEAVQKAQKGVFGAWSFRELPQYYQNRFFIPRGSYYEIVPTIREMVRFDYHNIAAEPYTPPKLYPEEGFDLILIRNVLIYFEKEKAKSIASRLFSHLSPGGWLATTPVEYAADIFDFGPNADLLHDAVIHKHDPSHTPFETNIQLPEYEFELPSTEDIPMPATPQIQNDDSRIKEEIGTTDHHPLTHYQDALKLLEAGEIANAKDHLRQSLYLDNRCVLAHILLGNLLHKEGKTEKAMRHIARAKELLLAKAPEEEIVFSGGMTAGDLLGMITTLREADHG